MLCACEDGQSKLKEGSPTFFYIKNIYKNQLLFSIKWQCLHCVKPHEKRVLGVGRNLQKGFGSPSEGLRSRFSTHLEA